MKKSSSISLTIVVFATLLIYGFYESMKGPALPRIQEDLGITELQLGLLLALNSLGYVVACSCTSAIARRISIKTCLIISLIVVALSGVFICLSPSYIVLVISFFILNLGNGMMEVSQGIIAAKTFTKNTGTMMNIAHFFFGVGMMLAPVISTSLMAVRFGSGIFGWRYLYLIVLSWALVPIIPAIISRLEKKREEKKKSGYVKLLKNPTLWLIMLIFGLGSICELGVVAWLVNFLEKAYLFSSEKAALQLTLFFVCLTFARLILGPLIDRVGLINTLAITTAFAGTMTVAGVLLGEPGAFLLVIAGVGIAPLYPTVMAVIAKFFIEEIDDVMTVVLTIMGIFAIIANLFLGGLIQVTRGVFTNLYGDAGVSMAYRAGYLFLGLCCFGSFITALVLKSKQKKAGFVV